MHYGFRKNQGLKLSTQIPIADYSVEIAAGLKSGDDDRVFPVWSKIKINKPETIEETSVLIQNEFVAWQMFSDPLALPLNYFNFTVPLRKSPAL
jgi:hypothetical protein